MICTEIEQSNIAETCLSAEFDWLLSKFNNTFLDNQSEIHWENTVYVTAKNKSFVPTTCCRQAEETVAIIGWFELFNYL